MSIFGCASDEQLKDELKEGLEYNYHSPCDDCEFNYINQCASCEFASPLINDSLNYKYDEDC